MERCKSHGLLNCKCEEPLTAYLARRFRESGHEYVDHGQLDVATDSLGDMERRVFDGRNMGGGKKQ